MIDNCRKSFVHVRLPYEIEQKITQKVVLLQWVGSSPLKPPLRLSLSYQWIEGRRYILEINEFQIRGGNSVIVEPLRILQNLDTVTNFIILNKKKSKRLNLLNTFINILKFYKSEISIQSQKIPLKVIYFTLTPVIYVLLHISSLAK